MVNPEATSSPPLVPDNVYVAQKEWREITEEQRQFLRDAAKVSMAHVIENGGVIAWGQEMAEFTMAVKKELHPQDGWVVTLPDE